MRLEQQRSPRRRPPGRSIFDEQMTGRCRALPLGVLPLTCLRPNEVRLAKLADLDLAHGSILLSNPKGEGSWAAPDYAPLPIAARSAVVDFLADHDVPAGREVRVADPSAEGQPRTGPRPLVRHASAETQGRHSREERREVSRLEDDAGYLPTDVQGPRASIEAVSRALRHHHTKTTESYYGRIRPDHVSLRLNGCCQVQGYTQRERTAPVGIRTGSGWGPDGPIPDLGSRHTNPAG